MLRERKNRKKNADKPPHRIRRVLVVGAVATPVAVLALWIAVNRVEWLGPFVADALRAVIGVDNVTRLEDFAYGVQDRVNRTVKKDEKPRAYWEVPSASPLPASAPSASADAPSAPPPAPFRPADVGPALESWSAPGDGQWVAMESDVLPGRPPVMFKTLLHPDKSRSWAEVFVVAVDLRAVDVHLVAGRREPEATEEAAMDIERPGTIPEPHRERAIAAFNGGFKTEHGQYGMRVGDITIVKAKPGTCAIARYRDASIRIATWEKLEAQEPDMVWWRQAPNCMYEDDVIHPRLEHGFEKKWGAQLDGKTVIRRSAIGISDDNRTLFVSITNHTTAKVLAEGMHHAGARTVAQLDVNFSYPKFVTFEPKEGKRLAVALAEGFEFSEDEFIRRRQPRDFFYLTPRGTP